MATVNVSPNVKLKSKDAKPPTPPKPEGIKPQPAPRPNLAEGELIISQRKPSPKLPKKPPVSLVKPIIRPAGVPPPLPKNPPKGVLRDQKNKGDNGGQPIPLSKGATESSECVPANANLNVTQTASDTQARVTVRQKPPLLTPKPRPVPKKRRSLLKTQNVDLKPESCDNINSTTADDTCNAQDVKLKSSISDNIITSISEGTCNPQNNVTDSEMPAINGVESNIETKPVFDDNQNLQKPITGGTDSTDMGQRYLESGHNDNKTASQGTNSVNQTNQPVDNVLSDVNIVVDTGTPDPEKHDLPDLEKDASESSVPEEIKLLTPVKPPRKKKSKKVEGMSGSEMSSNDEDESQFLYDDVVVTPAKSEEDIPQEVVSVKTLAETLGAAVSEGLVQQLSSQPASDPRSEASDDALHGPVTVEPPQFKKVIRVARTSSYENALDEPVVIDSDEDAPKTPRHPRQFGVCVLPKELLPKPKKMPELDIPVPCNTDNNLLETVHDHTQNQTSTVFQSQADKSAKPVSLTSTSKSTSHLPRSTTTDSIPTEMKKKKSAKQISDSQLFTQRSTSMEPVSFVHRPPPLPPKSKESPSPSSESVSKSGLFNIFRRSSFGKDKKEKKEKRKSKDRDSMSKFYVSGLDEDGYMAPNMDNHTYESADLSDEEEQKERAESKKKRRSRSFTSLIGRRASTGRASTRSDSIGSNSSRFYAEIPDHEYSEIDEQRPRRRSSYLATYNDGMSTSKASVEVPHNDEEKKLPLPPPKKKKVPTATLR